MIDTMLIRNYLDKKKQISRLEKDIKHEKNALKDMASKIHSMLSTEGAGKVNVDGVTVFPTRKMRANIKGGHSEELKAAFRAIGEGSMVKETINASQLSGYVNELDPDRMMSEAELRDALPEELRDHISLFEDTTIGVRKGS